MKIAVIGSGNVAWHLAEAWRGKHEVVLMNPRDLNGLPSQADVYIIAVSDSAIRDVSLRLPLSSDAFVAHTSGTTDISVLDRFPRRGVFYPLQTFSKGKPLQYSEIPVFLEATSQEDLDLLSSLAASAFGPVHNADSELRRRLHVAAVFACNFTNHLLGLADDLLREQGLDIAALSPLVAETIRKALASEPHRVQTGPAVRSDDATMQKHLLMLAGNPQLQDIYKTLSASIMLKHQQLTQTPPNRK